MPLKLLEGSVCGQVSFTKMSPESKKNLEIEVLLSQICRQKRQINKLSVSPDIERPEENILKAVSTVSLQSCTMTEIKKEFFDIRSDAKNVLLKQSGP